MNQLDPTHINFLRYIEDLRLAEREPILLLALIAAMLAILLALLGVRKAYRQTGAAPGSGRINSSIQELSLKLSDHVSRHASELTKLNEEVRKLSERTNRMEQEFALLTRRSYEQYQRDVTRHDSETSRETYSTEKKSPEIDAREIARPKEPSDSPSEKGIKSSLEKTRSGFLSRLKNVFLGRSAVSSDLFDEIEELLLASDLGVKTTQQVVQELREEVQRAGKLPEARVRELLHAHLIGILGSPVPPIVPTKRAGQPLVILVVGVNGVGKTTTIAKLASRFTADGAKVILGACDTFRAAAVDQLSFWAKKIGVPIVMGADGAKPSTVAFQAIHRGINENFDVVILDTAGRLHTRVNLMNELASVVQIIQREQPGAPHETLLVLDASTGQNALQQAREFNQAAQLTGVALTKLDGTPKGGIVVAIKAELGLPIRYIGVGEGVNDLRPFEPAEFVEAMLAESDGDSSAAEPLLGERAAVRRRRREGEIPTLN